jgi:hypothetical protein
VLPATLPRASFLPSTHRERIEAAMRRLSDDELRDVLARAEEIQRAEHRGVEVGHEIEAVVGAAEELGLTRAAVERAMRERLGFLTTPPAVGTQVFARSVDGRFYVADVQGHTADGVRVKFLRGTEHVVSLEELKPLRLVPGERVSVDWPWWGPWNCTVVTYDPLRQRVKLNDGWGYTETFSIDELWLKGEIAAPSGARTRLYLTLLGTGATVGALAGALLTFFLTR